MLNWKIFSDEKTSLSENFDQVFQAYTSILNSPESGFFHLPENLNLIQESLEIFEHFKQKKFFIHVGIGGSSLGPEMVLKSLGSRNGVEFIFINNIDPDDLFRQLQKVKLEESIIYIVSKSGSTAETMASMSILVNELKSLGIQESDFKNYFVFCTDPEKGDLKKLAHLWQIETLTIPANIGGRFSILTSVGFLPMLFAGINPGQVLVGAREIQKQLCDIHQGKAFFELACWLKDQHDRGVNQTVMMPYSSLLKEFSCWFVQLWAESLGKQGKGLTPIAAYGATDQHSQMQLFMEGPGDKTIFFIEIEKFQHDYSLKNSIPYESFQLLSPHSLGALMKAEFEGTIKALKDKGRPVIHMKIPVLNEENLGKLILFFESLTVLVGILLLVDPFNQPGVEAGKKYAQTWLKS